MKTIKTVYTVLSVLGFAKAYTDTPIIGVLTQETESLNRYFGNEHFYAYIAASYVKHLESAGARVMPIWIGQDKNYYRKVVQVTNGLVLPGGDAMFNVSHGYGDAGQMLYDIALEINEKGDYYPIYGICLGMELLPQVALGGVELRAHCRSIHKNLPLDFKRGLTHFRNSDLFADAPIDIIDTLKRKNVTYNYHQFCVTEHNFTHYGLDKDWKVLATNKDEFGLEFISLFESKRYPFYAFQFHPEKNPYEFNVKANAPHSVEAVAVSQYFANFFVKRARRNNHRFPNWNSEQWSLIYNYPVYFVGNQNCSFQQLYVFKANDFVHYF